MILQIAKITAILSNFSKRYVESIFSFIDSGLILLLALTNNISWK